MWLRCSFAFDIHCNYSEGMHVHICIIIEGDRSLVIVYCLLGKSHWTPQHSKITPNFVPSVPSRH